MNRRTLDKQGPVDADLLAAALGAIAFGIIPAVILWRRTRR